MKSLAPDSIDRLCQDLVDDGCTEKVIDRLLNEERVERLRQDSYQELMADVMVSPSSFILESLPDLAQIIINFSQ